jgi:hypothetical protein
LTHQWFNTESTNDNNLAEVKENMQNFNEEMKIDTKELKADEIDMLTCTPILAGRGLDKHVP